MITAIKWNNYWIANYNHRAWVFNANGTKEVGPITYFSNVEYAAQWLIKNEFKGNVPDRFARVPLPLNLQSIVYRDDRSIKKDVAERMKRMMTTGRI